MTISATFETATKGKIILYDLVGKSLIEQPFDQNTSLQTSLSLSDLAKGNYILMINTERGYYREKIIKE